MSDDIASVLVLIVQCESRLCDRNITKLKWLFSDPYFTIQICSIDSPKKIPKNGLSIEQYMENYYMRKILRYAYEGPYILNSVGEQEPQSWWRDLPVIIIKDSSISNLTPFGSMEGSEIVGGIKKRISTVLEKASEADLYFLCKWNDSCNKYVDVEGIDNIDNGSKLKWSMKPTSTQAIMYKPKSRDYIRKELINTNKSLSDLLNFNIANSTMLATVFVPNIIDYDISLATSDNDYNKLNECETIKYQQSVTNNSQYVWLIIILILVFLVAWFLVQLNLDPQYYIISNE